MNKNTKSYYFRVIISASALYSLAMLANWTQPMLLPELMDSFSKSELSAGFIPTVEMAVLAIVSMLCTRLLAHIKYWQIIVVGIFLFGFGNLASFYIESYDYLILSRIVCGIGAGMLLMVASAVVASFDDSERAYGVINTACVIVAMVAFAIGPNLSFLSLSSSAPLTFLILFSCTVLLLPLSLLMPFRLSMLNTVSLKTDSKLSHIPLDIVLIGIAVFISCGVFSSIWPFYAVLGESAGLQTNQINGVMAYSILFTLIGSMTACFIGHKFGRFRPTALGLVIMTVAMMSLSLSNDELVYQLFTGLNLFGLYIFIPYFLGYASQADSSGRGAAIIAGTFMLAAAAGPYLGGAILNVYGVEFFAWLALIANSIAFMLFCIVDLRQKNY